ncbi:MAG: ABC transporter ATP-binding protein [Candidatus Omnitrophica bacterium]|nr:ABC transporter ATP-binding protein [Candidatus Omnitrophota bacterium]
MSFGKYLYRHWKSWAVILTLWLISLPLSLLNPYLAKLIIDKAYPDRDLKLFLIIAVIGASIFALNSAINYFSSYLLQRTKREVHFDITISIFRHLQNLPLKFFNHKSTGEHIYKIVSDVNAVTYFLCDTIPQMFMIIPRAVFILIIIFFLNSKLALFAICIIPLAYLEPYFFTKFLRQVTTLVIEKSQQLWIRLYETFSHIHLIKALGKEDAEINRFEGDLKETMVAELKNERLSNIRILSGSLVDRIISGAVILYGGYLVIKGKMSLGSLSAVMIYLTQLVGLSKSINEFFQAITVSSISFKRLTEIMDTKPQITDSCNAKDYRIPRGGIEFKNVSFGYAEKFILQNLSFTIEPGAKIALVGPSGCGKSTLLALIVRLYELQEGAIEIDGLDIKQVRLKSLKEQIGIALQEEFLWNDTVKNNILYTKENASMDEVIRAVAIAEADDFINSLPQGFDTLIGENACRISEGQKQRLAIARAVIKRAKILILDEALSSLDSRTEDKIVDNLNSDFPDSTLILVSHRLSSVRKMDTVYYLESPCIIKTGTHQELAEENLKYRELFASQIEEAVI